MANFKKLAETLNCLKIYNEKQPGTEIENVFTSNRWKLPRKY